MTNEHFTDRWPHWKKRIKEQKNLSEQEFRLVVDSFFDFLSNAMSNPTMPSLRIGSFLRFYLSISNIERGISMKKWWMKKGNISQKNVDEYIEKVKPLIERLAQEEKGVYVARNWHKHFKKSAGKEEIVWETENLEPEDKWEKNIDYYAKKYRKEN